jgi:hypothetical protein
MPHPQMRRECRLGRPTKLLTWSFVDLVIIARCVVSGVSWWREGPEIAEKRNCRWSSLCSQYRYCRMTGDRQ